MTSFDLKLDPIKLNLFSSDRRTFNLHFDGLSIAVGLFIVMIVHFECIQSPFFFDFFTLHFFYKILNNSLTAGFQNVHPRKKCAPDGLVSEIGEIIIYIMQSRI